jgi:hypothetical protein
MAGKEEMNTFLLGPNHQQTARCLDPARLNRQIVECVHVAKALALLEIAREKYNRQIPFGVVFPPVESFGCLTMIPPSYQNLKIIFFVCVKNGRN